MSRAASLSASLASAAARVCSASSTVDCGVRPVLRRLRWRCSPERALESCASAFATAAAALATASSWDFGSMVATTSPVVTKSPTSTARAVIRPRTRKPSSIV